MTRVSEIAPDVFRVSTFIPENNIQMNQFLVRDEEPLLWHTGHRYLFAEVREAVGEVFNLTDGARVTKREFVGRVAELAGLRRPNRAIPLWLAWFLANLMERRAKRRGATEPPLVNKARYKFLGLNLDYSIAKAERVLGYRPPYTTEAGLVETMGEFAKSSSKTAPVPAS